MSEAIETAGGVGTWKVRGVWVTEDYVERLKSRMERDSISAAELSDASEFSPQQLSRWFNKLDMIPSVPNILRLEQGFIDARAKKLRGA